VKFDVSYGGAFYAFVNADDYNINMKEENFSELIKT
jgi:proline racemase